MSIQKDQEPSDHIRRAVYATALALLAAVGVWATSHTVHTATTADWLGEVGGYVTSAAYIVLAMGALFVFERIVFPSVDFFQEIIEEHNLALALLVGLALVAFALATSRAGAQIPGERASSPERKGDGVWTRTRCIRPGAQMPIVAFVPPASPRAPVAADTARRWEGSVEQPPGSNAGPAVERFLASVELGPGYPWCAAALSYWYEAACVEGPQGPDGSPIRSAGAVDFADALRTIDPGPVLHGRAAVPKGSGVIWKRRGTWKGHAEITLREWTGRCGRTIGGNTSPS